MGLRPTTDTCTRKTVANAPNPASNGDDDLSPRVPLFDVPDGLGGVLQRIGSVDDGRDLPGFKQLLQKDQVFLLELRDEETEPLAHEQREDDRPESAIHGSDQTAAASSDHDVRPDRGESTPARQKGMRPAQIEDDVESLPTFGEVLPGVVDDTIGTDRSDQVQVPGAGRGGHVRSECFGNLHGERAHATPGTVDENLLP